MPIETTPAKTSRHDLAAALLVLLAQKVAGEHAEQGRADGGIVENNPFGIGIAAVEFARHQQLVEVVGKLVPWSRCRLRRPARGSVSLAAQ